MSIDETVEQKPPKGKRLWELASEDFLNTEEFVIYDENGRKELYRFSTKHIMILCDLLEQPRRLDSTEQLYLAGMPPWYAVENEVAALSREPKLLRYEPVRKDDSAEMRE